MRTHRGLRPAWHAAIVVFLACLLAAPGLARAGDYTKYHTYDEMTAALKALVTTHPELAKLSAIGQTRGGRSVWAVEIAGRAGTPVEQRPALLIAAALEGDHLIGSELALYVVEQLLSNYAADPVVKQRLDSHVVYVIPRVNPDGAEFMFGPVKSSRRTNTTSVDADNDGRADEDGPEDLNKDGFITLMRVKDPKGAYMISPDDPRLMRRADPARGEKGGYAVYWEGIDNDGDGFINEDGPGGVDINRNFMHQYPYYQPDAGRHMASELETRAMLDYVLAHRNIAAILAFGESDNLIVPPTRRGELGAANVISLFDFADESTAGARRTGMVQDPVVAMGGRGGGMMVFDEYTGASGRGGAAAQAPTGRGGPALRPATTINPADVEYFLAISEKYREMTGLRGAPPGRSPAGAFFEYGYYQYGVPSFSTPGWGLPAAGARPAGPPSDTAMQAVVPSTSVPAGAAFAGGGRQGGGAAGGARQGGGGRGGIATTQATGADAQPASVSIDQRLLQWMDAEEIDGFITWQPFKHPTLGEVEIGGFKPYAFSNPPAARIADLGAAHAKFVLYLTSLFANVRIAKTEVINHGGGIFRIRAEVENEGFLPTAMAQGVTARSVKPTMVQLGVEPEAIVAGNEKTSFFQALPGSGGRQSYEWLIKGAPGASVTLKVVSQKGGADTATLKLQ